MTAPMMPFEQMTAPLLARTPLGRFATPDEIAPAVLFLASPAGALHHRPDARGRRRLLDRRLMVTGADVETFWRDGVVCLRGALPADLARGDGRTGRRRDQRRRRAPTSAHSRAHRRTGALRRGRRPLAHATGAARVRLRVRAARDRRRAPALVRGVALRGQRAREGAGRARSAPSGTRTSATSTSTARSCCTTWCPLDPVDDATGAMRFVRGSHRFGPRPTGPTCSSRAIRSRAPKARPCPTSTPAATTSSRSTLEPGDITVHHARTLHAAGANRSSRPAPSGDLGALLRRRRRASASVRARPASPSSATSPTATRSAAPCTRRCGRREPRRDQRQGMSDIIIWSGSSTSSV